MRKKKDSRIGELFKETSETSPFSDFSGSVKIEICGEHRITVENHKGILEYEDTEMKINCGRRVLKITGLGMTLQAMTDDEIAIVGQILGVEYLN